MKIRTGWVSNSSTSSFICTGYRIKEDSDEYSKLSLFDNEEIKDLPFEIIYCETGYILGDILMKIDLENTMELSQTEVNAAFHSPKIIAAKDFLQTKKEPSLFVEILEC